MKNITKFAIFNNFDWDTNVRDKGNNIAELKKMNIIYGRNYSGKTTLSRIIRSYEKGKLPEKYSDAIFNLVCEDGIVDQSCINNHQKNIRVYNKDFISDNLMFLNNENEGIEPFAILGGENVEVEKQIAIIEKELGNEETKTGHKYDLFLKKSKYDEKKQQRISVESDLNNKLTQKANQEIKRNQLFNVITYNVRNIESDINTIKGENTILLSETQVFDTTKLINEQTKADISSLKSYIPNFSDLYKTSIELLSRKIVPTKSIQELLDDSLLQEWVRQGVSYHKDKKETCAFCGNKIPTDLWNKLDAHFSKESEELRIKINKQIHFIEDEKQKINGLINITDNSFYSTYQDSFIEIKKNINSEIDKYINNLNILITELSLREKNIFENRILPEIDDNSQKIVSYEKSINNLIDENNSKTVSLEKDKDVARKVLRLNEVLKFIKDIDYDNEIIKKETLKNEELTLESEVKTAEVKSNQFELQIKELKNKLKDEKKGAEKVNEYLNNFFGHNGLKLEAIENKESSGYMFQIFRGAEIAHNLSEGECSLVAFCYFMAKLDDIETKGKDLIIWIDDPISSLDSNHIFFIYSLIEKVITKPFKQSDGRNGYNYKQLFISTHNLDFLKYLKRLSHPKENVEFFLIERVGDTSKIILMPDYLKKYITEFNYLFHQIYKCSKIQSANTDYECFYNFGNNLRKFLEAYLFYKYPSNSDIIVKLNRFFKGDDTATALSNRIENELSHLEEIFDRSIKPIDIPEIPKLAQFILDKIKEKDPEQYNSLLKSIDQ